MAKKSKPKLGRKKVEDKATRHVIYPRKSRIEALGFEKVTEICLNAIEREYKKLK
jgi:hypothetical protein